MNILILGSVALPIPPPGQGGTERMAWYQARGLSGKGHSVTLVAARGSKPDPSYRLVEIGGGDTVIGTQTSESKTPQAPITEGSRKLRKEAVYWAQVIAWLLDHGGEFDAIINNMRGAEAVLLPIVKRIGKPMVNIMHLPMFSELAALYGHYQNPVITISDAQREGYGNVHYVGTVFNGIELEQFTYSDHHLGYMLMMGSIAPHKNQKAGVEIAKKLGKKLIIAGKIGNPGYWDTEIAPHVDGEQIVHLGEITFEEKNKLYREAEVFLFPIIWPEPFGLVMIEAMACGTPVVAFNNGAISEVVTDGETGFVVEQEAGINALANAIGRIGEIDRAACRKRVQQNFTVAHMVDGFDRIIRRLNQELPVG